MGTSFDVPLRVRLSLSGYAFMLGEPIILDYSILNLSDEDLVIFTGREKNEWLAYKLTDEKGRGVPVRPDPRLRQGGIHSVTVKCVPGEKYQNSLVLTQFLDVSRPGQYTLDVRTHLLYTPSSDAAGLVPLTAGLRTLTVPSDGSTKAHSFAITVTEGDPERLNHMAAALREMAAQESRTAQQITMLHALFSMPETYALSAWRDAATDSRLVQRGDVIASELERRDSIPAADILADMIRYPPPEVSANLASPPQGPLTPSTLAATVYHSSAYRHLVNMYFHSDPQLKDHVAQIFIRHGSRPPDRPVVVID